MESSQGAQTGPEGRKWLKEAVPIVADMKLRSGLGEVFFFLIFIVLLFMCAYNAWVISPPCPHPLPYHPLLPLPLPPIPSIPGKNYFALISNFVEERV
jgi:hypothetical protein